MSEIIKITNKALKQLKIILNNGPEDAIGIIIGIDNSGCNGYSYKLDFAKYSEVSNLEFIEDNNVKVFIDPKATMFLLGSEMDYLIDKLSSRFVFNNPNEKNTCGCGESFSI
tara:strand:+ start:189 stop:524 length:336 start_codon:yes stop_codon:yes gene_type:complete